MTKSGQFGLAFHKINSGDYATAMILPQSENETHANLIFINSLDIVEIQHLIDTIDIIKTGKLYDPAFLEVQGLEGQIIEFNNPNFLIDGMLNIHMKDLQAVLKEWLEFKNNLHTLK